MRNKIAQADASNHVADRVQQETSIPINYRRLGELDLVTLPSGKRLDVKRHGSGSKLLVFIHGLGGSKLFYGPLLSKLNLHESTDYTSLLYDFEGHGLSPTSAASTITIDSLSQDLYELITSAEVPANAGVTLVAHSMGCLVAELFASQHPDLTKRLVPLGPPSCPLPQAGHDSSIQRAVKFRAEGMKNVLIAVPSAATSQWTQKEKPVAFEAVRLSLLTQDPEGYAKGCTALASAKNLNIDFAKLQSEVLIVAGEEDKVSPMSWAEKFNTTLVRSQLRSLSDVGHWHCFEDIDDVADAVQAFL